MALGWLDRHPTLSAALILIAVLHVCFFPFIWGSQSLLAGSRGVPGVMPDGAYYGGSQGPAIYRTNDPGPPSWVLEADAALVGHQYLQEKRPPLWNPYQSYGAPLAANMQSQPFQPLFALYALHPEPRAYNLFLLGRLFIAGFCAYLYLRLFLPFAPAIAGGVIAMLGGYHILFLNMPHLSVDVLLPAVFLTTERLLRRQSVRNVLLSAVVVFLVIVGGMPETTLLILSFGYAYFLFRVFTDRALRAAARTQVACFVFANAAGFALAGILLGPFVEFLRVSFDRHQVKNVGHVLGLAHDRFGLSIFTYVIPMLFGTAWKPVAPSLGGYASLRGFAGVLPMLFCLVAAGGLLVRYPHRWIAAFFSASAVVVVLKRYGAPPVNWIGYVPFFQMVEFRKYEEPLLAFAVAVLCGFGIDQLLSLSAGRRRMAVTLCAAFLVLIGIVAGTLPVIVASHADVHPYYLSLGWAAAILLTATLLILGPAWNSRRSRWLAAGLVALLVCEMAGNYILPVYYVLTRSATGGADPYRGAPYIDFLRAHTRGGERIFGADLILHPDWAGSFQLFDIRGLDAMYYRKYLPFVRYFLRGEVGPGPGGDLVERFTGGSPHLFDTTLKRRLLQLSSVKYLLSLKPLAVDSSAVSEILGQNGGRLAAGREHLVEARRFAIGGKTEAVLYEHPPYDRLPFSTIVTPERRQFFFNIAMAPAVYDGSQPVCGDGVEFRLEARDRAGRITLLYHRYIDPKHNTAERRWMEESVDLSGYLGQPIDLLFTTTPGPAGDTCMDWAGWGDPHFNGDTGAPPAFRQVYDREIKIYEYADRLPRAALYFAAETVPDDDAALARLGSPSLDIFQKAVVSAKDAAAVRMLDAPDRVREARIVSYTSQEVRIEAEAEKPALLVLNDSDYPGWSVWVDGQPSRWFTANYLFRGVMLAPGRHRVRFAYQPASFTAGAAFSAAGLVCLAGFAVWRRRGLRVSKPQLVH